MAPLSTLSRRTRRRRAGTLVLACATLAAGAAAQSGDAATLPAVSVTGRSSTLPADVSGFGNLPAERLPMQTLQVGEAQLRDSGGQGLRELSRADASVADAYNAVGYWDSLTVRGYVIDQRYNYRRDGLPISGETAIALDNKARLELLKGTSGIQAGVSAPGGLVNLAVKRPEGELRSAYVELRGARTALAAADLSTRLGTRREFGLRLNAAIEELQPELRDADGRRHLFALAGDWRLAPGTLLEAEFETSRRRQPSQPGFSLLGDRVPDAGDVNPRLNLNNQPWSQPVVFAARYASLRLTHKLGADWRAVLHTGSQRLRTDDRLAFPYGCYDAGADVYYADRYCPDGSFDLYDYRSENERRRMDAVDAGLHGTLRSGGLTHTLSAGVLRSRFEARLQPQAYNAVGSGTVDGRTVTPADPTLAFDNTDRDERQTEFYLRDAVQLGRGVELWLGLRHTRLARSSVSTSGTEATRYRQHFTTPWLATSWAFAPTQRVYASWGRGVESDVVPNRPRYGSTAGRALPALESRQIEAGYRHGDEVLSWGLTAFRIDRPAFADTGLCDDGAPGSCERRADGEAVHRGLELQARARLGHWTLGGSAQWLHARREGSADATLDGTRPPNVPRRSLRLQLGHEPAALPGLALQAALTAESERNLLPAADSPRIPGWARVDLGARYAQSLAGGRRLLWRAGIDNLADRRAWKESPYQFSHVYLYPMAPRTWRVSVQAEL